MSDWTKAIENCRSKLEGRLEKITNLKEKYSVYSFLLKALDSYDFDEGYSVSNGIIGMKRDIFARLMGICRDSQKMRVMFGLCKQSFDWKDHFSFKPMLDKTPPRFIHNPILGCPFFIKDRIISICYPPAKIFYDSLITTGLFKFDIKIVKLGYRHYFSFGIMHCTNKRSFGAKKVDDSMSTLYLSSGYINTKNYACVGYNAPYSIGNRVGVELDLRSANKRDQNRIRFLRNGRLQPIMITKIPSPVRFCLVAHEQGCEIQFISLHRLIGRVYGGVAKVPIPDIQSIMNITNQYYYGNEAQDEPILKEGAQFVKEREVCYDGVTPHGYAHPALAEPHLAAALVYGGGGPGTAMAAKVLPGYPALSSLASQFMTPAPVPFAAPAPVPVPALALVAAAGAEAGVDSSSGGGESSSSGSDSVSGSDVGGGGGAVNGASDGDDPLLLAAIQASLKDAC